ncbi:dienelactone hydrolase [Psychrobacter sp. YP14]|uniref:Dienelactone hydrolase family protein n=1 Tax=Psychrobacter raelei TaxID=2565531 RepID=A0AAT9PEF6_9GAMM|nr:MULTISPECIES: dienelactone hydrolase family protein [unclassified Psychrobacter]AWT49931.1 dienelactone hydrolase [Psychrobacter sp. YP14]UNK05268.1 dienelactone hydrolase family protein [Psychrobacter sp. PraFG1]
MLSRFTTLATTKAALSAIVFSVATVGLTQTAAAITTKNVVYTVDNEPYEGYYAKADKPNAPFILLLHDWDGLTEYERMRADMLAEEGYNVFAADAFGQGIRPTSVDDKMHLTGGLDNDRNKMRRLMAGALNAAQAEGNDVYNGVTMGYCFGGTLALELARSGFEQKGFVIFHGGLDTPAGQNYDNTKGNILVFHGTSDDVAPFDSFVKLAERLDDANVPNEMTTYGNVGHAFTESSSDSYNAYADKNSWNRYLDFLDTLYDK